MTIRYSTHEYAGCLTPQHLSGFFADWPNPPSPETHLKAIRGSNAAIFAIDDAHGRVVGIVHGLTNGVLMTYVWLWEVLPEYENSGVRAELMRRFLDRYGQLYQVNAVAGPESIMLLKPHGFELGDQMVGMCKIRYDWQDGGPNR